MHKRYENEQIGRRIGIAGEVPENDLGYDADSTARKMETLGVCR